jgi:hypothetical protein
MIKKSIRAKLNEAIRPGTTAAVLMVGGYWVSQALAVYFVSGSVCGLNSKISGALFLAVFALFFFVHFSRPWSRLAAFFGLCSLGIITSLMVYVHVTYYDLRVPSVASLILFSGALVFAGILLDAEKYRVWAANDQRRLRLTGAPTNSPTDDMANYI